MNFRQKIQQVDICFHKSVTIYPQIHDLHFLYIKLGHLHNFSYKRGRSQTTFTYFWPFLTPPPPPWLTALLNKICQIYLVTLTFYQPPLPP